MTCYSLDHKQVPKFSNHIIFPCQGIYVKGLPQQAEVALGVPGRLRPWIFLMLGTTRVVGHQPYTTVRLYPRRNPWYSFLEAESTPGHMVPSVAMEKIL
jgi:hypothetical protein